MINIQGAVTEQNIKDVKKQARVELAKSIKVWIRSEMKKSVIYTQDGQEETIRRSINKVTESYVDMGLQDVSVQHEIDDAHGRVCAFATLSKAEHQKHVADDIKAKKDRVLKYYTKHEEMLAKGDPKTALDSLLAARKWRQEDFRDLPVKGELSGQDQNLHAAIDASISHLVGRFSVEALEKRLPFGADGKVKGQVQFSVKYAGKEGDLPAANLKLSVSFVKGQGKTVPDSVTSLLGVANVRVFRVEPGHGGAILRGQLSIPGIEVGKTDSSLPYADIELYKVPAVALLISMAGGGSISGVEDKVKAIVAERGFELADAPGDLNADPRSSDFEALMDRGADNLVVVKVKASGSQPSKADLAVGHASAVLSLFDVKSRKMLFSDSVSTGRAYGASAKSAKWQAISKLKPKLYKVIEKSIKKYLAKN